MNITRLTISQVSKLWDSIRYGILEAFAPEVDLDEQALQEILCRLLKEEMQCWCIYDDKEYIWGHVITSIENEFGKKNLIIYSEHAFNVLPSVEAYAEIIDKVERFAKANDCHNVIAYSAKPNAISIAEKFGYSSDCRVLIKGV